MHVYEKTVMLEINIVFTACFTSRW